MKKLFVCCLLLSSFFIQADTIQNISQAQLLSLQQAAKSPAFILLDVRSEEEYNAGHISGAINISHTNIEKQLPALSRYKDQKVIVHCRSGRRAKIAETLLQENGFNHIYHLTGDYNAWVKAELPLVKK